MLDPPSVCRQGEEVRSGSDMGDTCNSHTGGTQKGAAGKVQESYPPPRSTEVARPDCLHLGNHTGVNTRQGDHGLSIPNTKNYLVVVALLSDHRVNVDTLKN